MSERLGVLILNYEKPDLTLRCLFSLERALSQTENICADIIVVDNASQDSTYFKLYQYLVEKKGGVHWIEQGGQTSIGNPNILAPPSDDCIFNQAPWVEQKVDCSKMSWHLLRAKQNGGYAQGNNLGLRYAFGLLGLEWIFIINNDIEFNGNKIFNDIIEHIHRGSHQPLSIVSTFDSTKGKKELTFSLLLGRLISFDATESISKWLKAIPFCSGSSFVISRSCFSRLGQLLSEGYFMYVEDIDFSIRLWQSGVGLSYLFSDDLIHLVGQSSGGNHSPFAKFWYNRNMLILFKKFFREMKVMLFAALIFLVSRPLVFLYWLVIKRSPPHAFAVWRGVLAGLTYR